MCLSWRDSLVAQLLIEESQQSSGCNGRTDRRASGLGLYLCRRICQNLGIDISISSTVGEGTTVRLDLGQYKLGKE